MNIEKFTHHFDVVEPPSGSSHISQRLWFHFEAINLTIPPKPFQSDMRCVLIEPSYNIQNDCTAYAIDASCAHTKIFKQFQTENPWKIIVSSSLLISIGNLALLVWKHRHRIVTLYWSKQWTMNDEWTVDSMHSIKIESRTR